LIWFLHSDSPFSWKKNFPEAITPQGVRVATFYDLPGIPFLISEIPVAALIRGDEFLRRVRVAAGSCGHELHEGLVSYFDEKTYTGEVGIFRKRDAFRYQGEFRIALVPGTDKPLRLPVGDLSDITIIGKLLN
jgi:hypothetical protein